MQGDEPAMGPLNFTANPLPRKLASGNVSFPCALACVVKSVEKFSDADSTLMLKLTLILRIKISGYEHCDAITEHLSEKLKWRINEVEEPIVNPDTTKVIKTHSTTSLQKNGNKKVIGEEDMFVYTIRFEKECGVNGDYSQFPFDTVDADLRIELSHFEAEYEGKKIQFRFDVLRQANELSFKPTADALPQFGIDYERCGMKFIKESKPYKDKNGKETPIVYYPGSILHIALPRNPIQPTLQLFAPSLILSIFIMAASNIEGSLADTLATVSLSLLTFVALAQQIREQLPATLEVTWIEKVVFLYILYSLVPVMDALLHNDEKQKLSGWNSLYIFGAINTLIIVSFLCKFIPSY